MHMHFRLPAWVNIKVCKYDYIYIYWLAETSVAKLLINSGLNAKKNRLTKMVEDPGRKEFRNLYVRKWISKSENSKIGNKIAGS